MQQHIDFSSRHKNTSASGRLDLVLGQFGEELGLDNHGLLG